jgi:steroid delta-isomerase-like uncharacterized protein
MQNQEANREALIKSHFEAIQSTHDVQKTLAAFTRPRYDVPALGIVAEGQNAVDFVSKLFEAFPDFRVETEAFHHAGNAVIVEGKVHATQNGAWLHVPASGRQVQVPLAMIFQFEGADLVGEKVYFDHATVLQQIGAF